MSFPISTHQLTPPDFSIITIHENSEDAQDSLPCAVASLADQCSIKSEQILQHLGEANNLWSKLSKELQLSKWKQRFTLRLVEEKNISFHEAIQKATIRILGAFVGFLQPDEQYLPEGLVAVEKYFQAHPEIDLVFTGGFVLDNVTKKTTPHPAVLPSLEYLWSSQCTIIPSTLFCRSLLLKKDFPFYPRYENRMFDEWLLRLLQSGKKIGLLNIPTTLRPACSTPINHCQGETFPVCPPTMKLFASWWKFQHARAFKKALRHFPNLTHPMIYQLTNLTERTTASL